MRAGIYINESFNFVIVYSRYNRSTCQVFDIYHENAQEWRMNQFSDATVSLIETCCEYTLVEYLE